MLDVCILQRFCYAPWFMVIYIYVMLAKKMKLSDATKRNGGLSLQDASPWRETNGDECDVVWRNLNVILLHASPLYI